MPTPWLPDYNANGQDPQTIHCPFVAFVKADGVSVSAASNAIDASAPIQTALLTAARNDQPVDYKDSTGWEDRGLVSKAPNDRVEIRTYPFGNRVFRDDGREIYGRLGANGLISIKIKNDSGGDTDQDLEPGTYSFEVPYLFDLHEVPVGAFVGRIMRNPIQEPEEKEVLASMAVSVKIAKDAGDADFDPTIHSSSNWENDVAAYNWIGLKDLSDTDRYNTNATVPGTNTLKIEPDRPNGTFKFNNTGIYQISYNLVSRLEPDIAHATAAGYTKSHRDGSWSGLPSGWGPRPAAGFVSALEIDRKATDATLDNLQFHATNFHLFFQNNDTAWEEGIQVNHSASVTTRIEAGWIAKFSMGWLSMFMMQNFRCKISINKQNTTSYVSIQEIPILSENVL